jgi:hypothetical protein
MKKLTLAAATALTFALAVPMIANAHGHKGGNPFEKLDTNADGTVARSEAEAAALAQFAEIDANKDGFLTQDEMKSAHEARRAEMQAKWAEQAEGGERRKPKGERDPAKMEARKAKMEEKSAERFAAADTNGDGKWSQIEFTAEHLSHFAKADTDGDGNITAAEQEAAKGKMKEHRGKWRDKPAAQ